MEENKNIHEAILSVMNEVDYVQKEKKKGVGYSIKSEEGVLSVIRPAMMNNGIIMFPVDVKDIHHSKYEAGQYKNTWNRIVATHVYRFLHTASGTYVDIATLGDGADTGDKAGNKSMTTSKKYALLEVFLLRTGDDPDETQSPSPETLVDQAKDLGGDIRGNITPQWIVDNQLSENIPSAANLINLLGLAGKSIALSEPKIKLYRQWRQTHEPKDAAAKTIAGENYNKPMPEAPHPSDR